MPTRILPMLLAMSLIGSSGAADLHWKTSAQRVTLLELFTSEGCNSCPPAEKWFSKLEEDPRLWKEIVPVAFHVDYWDGLGWKDPFGTREFSQRQHNYAAQWNSRSVYTPGFVLNGAEWRGWFDGKALPANSAASAGVLSADSADGRNWQVNFSPTAKPAGACTLHAARLGSGLSVAVKSGENGGSILQHSFVVLRYAEVSLSAVDGRFRGAIKLPHVSTAGVCNRSARRWHFGLPKRVQRFRFKRSAAGFLRRTFKSQHFSQPSVVAALKDTTIIAGVGCPPTWWSMICPIETVICRVIFLSRPLGSMLSGQGRKT